MKRIAIPVCLIEIVILILMFYRDCPLKYFADLCPSEIEVVLTGEVKTIHEDLNGVYQKSPKHYAQLPIYFNNPSKTNVIFFSKGRWRIGQCKGKLSSVGGPVCNESAL